MNLLCNSLEAGHPYERSLCKRLLASSTTSSWGVYGGCPSRLRRAYRCRWLHPAVLVLIAALDTLEAERAPQRRKQDAWQRSTFSLGAWREAVRVRTGARASTAWGRFRNALQFHGFWM